MSPLRCPRCAREAPRPSALCAGCGAPLLLGEEAPAPPLDAPLELDRRRRGDDLEAALAGLAPIAGAQPPAGAPAPRDELAAFERSHWDLGAALAAATPDGPLSARDVLAADGDLGPAAVPGPVRPRVPGGPLPGLSPGHRPGPGALAGAVEAAPAGLLVPFAALDDELPEPEVEEVEVHVEHAPAWRRAAAWVLDGLPFAAAGAALARALVRDAALRLPAPDGVDELLDLLARERVIVLSVAAAVALALATYTTLAHALAGQTLGKRLLRLRVIGPDGRPPSPARSAARCVLAGASAGLLGLGFLLALFTRSGRSLHDLIARTWVVKAP